MASNKSVAQQTRETVNQASDMAEQAANRVSDIGERMQSGAREMGRHAQCQLHRMHLTEATIPDAFRGAPKFISPRVHSFLDLAVTLYFTGLGIAFAVQRKKGPAIAAFVNAGMVGTVSALTDYKGTGRKPIDFKLHGTLDAVQATTAALAPELHGFAGDIEARFFWGQAANEALVISGTDWDMGMPEPTIRRVV
jgi:hypothetical protein